ncbi:cobaltochelatase subunit CobN [Jannaschia seohaensis]|uniref:magnesium chelatase n=1 Tax=Jannaschia seohaensis TaxID=475081 RepID=A0A2Y9A0R1_9RHOB|nr:cobaltochelatase subunit CobN [Jannaschia seohaensis]PWJ21706.1 magnesium chelatase subunit H [Jannaschia seohaensis]SSA37984.1 magnesium chelatase subunit H [Jannaschia seohaensis]
MRGDGPLPYRIVIVTMDAHAAGPVDRVGLRLAAEFPGLTVEVHAAAAWSETPGALEAARAAVDTADIVICGLLFIDEHVRAILPNLLARRDRCDAMVGMVSDPAVVKATRMGELDMAAPSSAAVELLKRLRGSKAPSGSSGEKQMRMLRRLPKLLRYIPGKAQDLRAWFLCMQYWLGGSDDNFEGLLRHLIGRYGRFETRAAAPIAYPEVGLYHPDLANRITTEASDLPGGTGPAVGLLLMRSYVLAGDTAHYDAVIRAFEARGIRVLPAFAGGLDMRPAIAAYLDGGRIDALVSLSGFSLVGGPAYNDSPAAVETLVGLDMPYLAAHPLEFQTLGQWAGARQGLGPVETTMLIALPEIDGATCPTVFAGRHGAEGCHGCARMCRGAGTRELAPCPERVEALVAKAARLAALRRSRAADRKVAIVLFNFPPNAGRSGSAAYLAVWESLLNTLRRLAAEGHDVEVPPSVEALRAAVLEGNAAIHGQDANVAAHVAADRLVAEDPYLAETEAAWGPAPGRAQSDGRGVFVLGARFGNVFVGLQPAFGYEGDPMRLLFEKGFAPTHAFGAFYRWLRDDFGTDAVLHFGMHGALEFMPGRQAGMGPGDWPDRLIGDLPNVYLYASNNPSEASLAKRRSNAVTVTHVTPPLLASGLYKGLQALKDSVDRWRGGDRSEALADLIADQAAAVDMDGADPDALWLTLLETEAALIPDGLHVVGGDLSDAQMAAYLGHQAADARASAEEALRSSAELDGLMRALSGRFVAPVPGGDLIRSPEVLPAGRNIHAFDPFRMPTAYALADGARQADLLIETHAEMPRSVALVLWGSDNIKSDGVPIGQALALLGARPRFDHYGRLAGAELIPLAELGRPRIDVVMTLSGIFRDLLPLQTRLLAEAAWLAATADEPETQNFVRAHALAYAAKVGCDLETAALRVFSNAEGAYGSNVNQLVDSGAWEDEGELADAFEARKSFAYGRDGKAARQAEVMQAALSDVDLAYQNLESVELGVTTVDHYFDTLGGISRAVKRAKGSEAPVYIGDQTTGAAKVRTLADQVALETRSRSLNPRWFEGLLKHGSEGVSMIEAQVTNTLGWSATTGSVEPWVYARLSETFVLDEEMRRRLAELNPKASARMANRLLEAGDRDFWQPDAETLAALQNAADELEDRLEGIVGMAAE